VYTTAHPEWIENDADDDEKQNAEQKFQFQQTKTQNIFCAGMSPSANA
jgi:hypothetical protein